MTEYVEGEPLRRLMGRSRGLGQVSVDRVLAIGRQLFEALGYMHRQGVIHGDLKPENISGGPE